MNKALLALEDGRVFSCRSFTGSGETFGEIVFNTGMTGYQEVLTDPSYKGQMVTMTYPLIGNYGINPDDVESRGIQVSGFLVREYQDFPSNYRLTKSLKNYLMDSNVLGVEGFDTRALTRHLRVRGAMRAGISTMELDPDKLIKKVKMSLGIVGKDMVKQVTTESAFCWINGKPVYNDPQLDTSVWKGNGKKVVVYDFGIKYNMLRSLEEIGCEIIVLPASTPSSVIYKLEPDGIFLSNGPGDPDPLKYAISNIQDLINYKPIFGICLGHQLLALALGAKTYKLKFGHRGSNQPVKNLMTGKVEITSQNHGFAVDADSLSKDNLEITHINLNDNTVEGFKHQKLLISAVQYHPEASPGPHDASYLFNEFRKMMER